MSSRGIRSPVSQQRRDAKKFIFDTSKRDLLQAETVSRVDWFDVFNHLLTIHDTVDVHVARVERGEVLVDSRGRGTFQ